MLETFCEFTFDAAHKTTSDTPLHGHTFRVRVVVVGEPEPVFGWSHDLRDIENAVAAVRRQVDHTLLNDIEGLETPTLENVAQWLWRRFEPKLRGLARIELSRGFAGATEGVILRGVHGPGHAAAALAA
jgi:6-pyruvoyltetrahydropterin/6-carboxytetrahydropterin synthase